MAVDNTARSLAAAAYAASGQGLTPEQLQSILDTATIRSDKAQTLTDEQKAQALSNLGLSLAGGEVF